MYTNNKYHCVKGQGYNSRSKVNNLGQTCLIQYRLYITSSTFVNVSIAEPVFVLVIYVFVMKCHALIKLDNLSLNYSRSSRPTLLMWPICPYLFAGMKYNGIIIWLELCCNGLYVAILLYGPVNMIH